MAGLSAGGAGGGNKLNIDHLTEGECERILGVLQRDYHLRSRERTRLRDEAVEIWNEQQRRNILSSHTNSPNPARITDTHCVSCLSAFSLLFNRPIICNQCQQRICKKCCRQKTKFDKESICHFCLKKLPEESIPTTTSKPPKHPRDDDRYSLYSSQPLTTPYNEQQSDKFTLRNSLNMYTPINSNGDEYDTRYGTEQALNFRSHQTADSLSCYMQPNAQYHDRSDIYQRKYSSHHDLDLSNGSYTRDRRYGSSSSISSVSQYCSQCGDSLSLNVKRKAQCVICMQWICKLCAMWEPKHEGYVCEAHEEETGYEHFNRNNSEWMYDSENRKFVMTHSAEIAATIAQRLSDGNDYQSLPTLDEIPSLSLEDFKQSMGISLSNSPENNSQDTIPEFSKGKIIDPDDFFKTRAPENTDSDFAESLNATLGELDRALAETTQTFEDYDGREISYGNRNLEEVTFDSMKEEETKKFLIDIDVSVQKIKECLNNNDGEAQTEEMLTYHRSAISAMITNLEQSLHIAVDKQTSSGGDLVKHTAVASHVSTIIEQFSGESLPESAMSSEGMLNYGEAADAILIKILDEEESQRGITDEDLELSPRDYSTSDSIDTASHSDYGSYKLPSFDNKNSHEVDPDLISLGGHGSITLIEEEDDIEDYFSEDGSPWDSESIASGTSNNWLFRGKIQALDSLSGKSSIFNAHSESEESLNIMYVPESQHNNGREEYDLSDDGSDSTLTSLSGDSLPDNLDNLTPRATEDTSHDFTVAGSHDTADEEEMIRTELRRTNAHGIGAKPGYVSVSRNTSVSTPNSVDRDSDLSELGEESAELKFTTKPKSRTLKNGDVAKFTCTVQGTSPIDVYWFKEGVDDTDAIESDDKFEVTSQEDRHSLEIFFTSPQDNGQYLCLAKNDVTSSHWLFGLTVEDSSDFQEQKAPLFVKELYDMEAQEGETIKFRCKVRAYPPPRVTWYKDGKRLSNTNSYKLEKFGNRDYVLTISGVTPDHDAEFTCLAKNNAGEAKSTAQLLIDSADADEHRLQSKGSKDKISRQNVSDKLSRRQRNYAKAYGSDDLLLRKDDTKTQGPMQTNAETMSNIINSNISLTLDDSENVHNTHQNITNKPLPRPHATSTPRLSENESHTSQDIFIQSCPPSSEGKEVNLVAMAKSAQSQPMNQNTGESKAPRRSLRSALRKEPEIYASTEENSTATVTPTRTETKKATHLKHQDPPTEQKRESSVVELAAVSPLRASFPPLELSSPEHMNTTPDPKPVTQEATATSKTNSISMERKKQTKDVDQIPSTLVTPNKRAESAVIDIQPGHVREKQFLEMGDNILRMSKSPSGGAVAHVSKPAAKHNKASDSDYPALLTSTHAASQSDSCLSESASVLHNHDSAPLESNKPHTIFQGAAPSPPEKDSTETIELRGTTTQEEIPTSRGEWGEVFPSVRQRRASFGSDSSADFSIRNTRSPATECNNNVNAVKPKYPKKSQAPVPPTSNNSSKEIMNPQPQVTPTLQKQPTPQLVTAKDGGDQDSAKKKTVKKIVKRTVSVKRSSIPASPSFGDGPPDDGCDYIKICGKWVKMKKKTAQAHKMKAGALNSDKSEAISTVQSERRGSNLSSQIEEDDIPHSRSEWGDNVKIGAQMSEFKRVQEAAGSIITGRSLGPITKV